MNKDIHPIAFGAGAAVLVGSFFLFSRKKKQCTEFPGIYKKSGASGGLSLTESAQESVISFSRQKIRSIIFADEVILPGTIQLEAAQNLAPSCDWMELKTDEQKAVYNSIGKIVTKIVVDAKADPESFLESME